MRKGSRSLVGESGGPGTRSSAVQPSTTTGGTPPRNRWGVIPLEIAGNWEGARTYDSNYEVSPHRDPRGLVKGAVT